VIQLIAAIARNRVIGKGSQLPWRLPADLKHFKALTMGHVLVMGRKTFESIGRPLPGRTTIVITRDRSWQREGVEVAHSLDEALARAAGREVFIAGGAEIYAQSLPRADRLQLTLIDADFDGDAWFPEWDERAFALVHRERCEAGAEFPHAYEFRTYEAARSV
jgi:dihydrofolate reductase